MNYDKFDGTKSFDDFDVVAFLSEKLFKVDCEGNNLFVLDRDSSFFLLKALKFNLTEKKKRGISCVCSSIRKHGKMLTPPKKPIKINTTTNTVTDGLTCLFVLLYQRTPRVVWIELEH